MSLADMFKKKPPSKPFALSIFPERNAFLDVSIGGNYEMLPIEALNVATFDIRRPTDIKVGQEAVFRYKLEYKVLGFKAACILLLEDTARFALPNYVQTLGSIENQRGNFRLKCVLWARYRFAATEFDFIESSVADINSTSVGLLLIKPIPLGCQLQVEIRLKNRAEPIVTVGTITRVGSRQKGGKHLVGIKFDTIAPDDVFAIQTFMGEHQESLRKRNLALH